MDALVLSTHALSSFWLINTILVEEAMQWQYIAA